MKKLLYLMTIALIATLLFPNIGFGGRWSSLIATQAALISMQTTTPIPQPNPQPGPTPIPVPDIGSIQPPTNIQAQHVTKTYSQHRGFFFRRR